jgi:hypothetical protein
VLPKPTDQKLLWPLISSKGKESLQNQGSLPQEQLQPLSCVIGPPPLKTIFPGFWFPKGNVSGKTPKKGLGLKQPVVKKNPQLKGGAPPFF